MFPAPDAVEIIAHRGYSARFPENTLPALAGALDEGATSLEWDVRIAADGVPVVIHDEDLARTSDGTGKVVDFTAEELSLLDAGSWFSPRFSGTVIPTLAQAVEHVRDRAIQLYPELKAIRDAGDLDTILEILRRGEVRDRTTLLSLDEDLLSDVRQRDPHLSLGRVVAAAHDLEPAARWVEEDGRSVLDPDRRLLIANPDHTRRLVERGVPLVTWTVDRPSQAETLRQLGISRITTNQVSRLLSWARAVASPLEDGQ